MAYGNFKDLPGRTPSDEILRDKAFNIAKKYKIRWLSNSSCFDGVYLLDKKTSGTS